MMMGVSTKRKRDALIKERATGIKEEQNADFIFEKGHRYEKLARVVAEEFIGDDLYPMTGTEGKYSASFDGLTTDWSVAWEHKMLNDELRAPKTSSELPKMYRVQMEQQLRVSGAERCLLSATKWDGKTDELIDQVHFWYYPDDKLWQDIQDAWDQFEKDVEAYVHKDEVVKPKATAIMALPSLSIKVIGEVSSSNLAEFKDAATTFISNISTTLVTDEDFVQAEETIKFCKSAEDNVDMVIVSSRPSSIDELIRTLEHLKSQLRDKRLLLEKLVKSEKENRKLQIISLANNEAQAHVSKLEEGLAPMRLSYIKPDFSEAIKGKKKIDAMQSAVNDMMAQFKTATTQIARETKLKLDWFVESVPKEIALSHFRDLQQLLVKPFEDFVLFTKNRISDYREAEAAKAAQQREQIRREEEAKARAEADAKVAAEVAQKMAIEKAQYEEKMKVEAMARFSVQQEAEQKRLAALSASAKPTAAVVTLGENINIGVDIAQPGSDKTVITTSNPQGETSYPGAAKITIVVEDAFNVNQQQAIAWIIKACNDLLSVN